MKIFQYALTPFLCDGSPEDEAKVKWAAAYDKVALEKSLENRGLDYDRIDDISEDYYGGNIYPQGLDEIIEFHISSILNRCNSENLSKLLFDWLMISEGFSENQANYILRIVTLEFQNNDRPINVYFITEVERYSKIFKGFLSISGEE